MRGHVRVDVAGPAMTREMFGWSVVCGRATRRMVAITVSRVSDTMLHHRRLPDNAHIVQVVLIRPREFARAQMTNTAACLSSDQE